MRPAIGFRLGLAIACLALAHPAAAQQPTAADEARELYRRGARFYNLGQYDSALEAFEQAYALSGAKPLLFNIAQAHRLAGPGHCERALQAYSGYLREEPNTSNAEEVRQRIEEMKTCAEREQKERENSEKEAQKAAQAAQTSADSKSVAPPPATPVPALRTPSIAPVLTTVGGAALSITGGLMYWRARLKFNEVEASCPCTDGQFSGWQTVTSTSYALMAVGGAAVVGGAIWWALDRKKARASQYGLMLQPNRIDLVGTF